MRRRKKRRIKREEVDEEEEEEEEEEEVECFGGLMWKSSFIIESLCHSTKAL